MKPETVVLIPNFNGEHHLRECLNSLLAQTYKRYKIILIDNGSADGSVNYVKENFSEVEIIKLDKNYGFSFSVNKGIFYSMVNYKPEYIVVLNNDTRVDKGWLHYLVKSIKSDEKIVSVASNMLFYDNPSVINSHGGTCNFIGDGFDINIFKKMKSVNNFRIDILFSCAGATIIRANALSEIGFFDERYFAYSEDLDWGWRANIYGYKVIFEEKAIVYHKMGSTMNSKPELKEYLCKRNALCTIIKNYELKTLTKVIPFLFLNYFTYPFWVLINKRIPLNKKIKFITIPLKSVIWNIKHVEKTLSMRKEIQEKRVVDDSRLFKLMVKNG